MNRLFVYGSLTPNKKNFYILKNISGLWQKAFTFGFIKKIIIAKDTIYDAIVLNPNGNKINGYLFTSYSLKNYWSKIDNFEGQYYYRTIANVYLKNKNLIQAYIYSFNLKHK
jgi:gamma-glutamylcyclotransferase (GGCT)/AIG2-like uncharacterized protein YtfP